MRLKEHKGVAGLISAITIVIVFGLASAAFLQLSSQQASLIGAASRTIDLQGKKASEQLQFKIMGCSVKGTAHEITINANSTWSESSSLDAVIFISSGNVTDSLYIPTNERVIPAMAVNEEVKVNATTSTTPPFSAILVTELGKKFNTPEFTELC